MKKRPWRKILYEHQDYPDNYVDKSFLDELRKNVNTRQYELRSVITESGLITQQISSVGIFVSTFVYMDEGILSPTLLFLLSAWLTLVGYVFVRVVHEDYSQKRTILEDVKTLILFLGFLFSLSPILKTLTDSISTDTIYAMTVCMLSAHLLFHNYSEGVSRAVSLNASIFASVCLASRLASSWHAFVTVTFAMQIFAFFPLLRQTMRNYKEELHSFMTWALAFVAMAMIGYISTLFWVLYIVVHLAVTFVCPYWLVQLQSHKNNIHGPWDEAMIPD